MKKIVYLFVLLLSFSSCDDGELTLESFNFEDVDIQDCDDENSYLIFKTKKDELLLVSLSKENYEAAFNNVPESVTTPREYPINSTNQVIYRKYTGTVSKTTVCSVIPVSSPTVSKEWGATGGTIRVQTTVIPDPSVSFVRYNHNITFLNVNFASTDNSFSFESYLYGDYEIRE
ncbi:MAG: hypothetical protein HC854_01490 [Flavobacterium sp.]|nr:hypothetical protein [Flavobacterium sp.]